MIFRSDIFHPGYPPAYCCKQEPAANLKTYFSKIKQYLTKRWRNANNKFRSIDDEVLRKILERTMDAEDLKKEVSDHLKPTPIAVVVSDIPTVKKHQSDGQF
jgi:esterase/lipase